MGPLANRKNTATLTKLWVIMEKWRSECTNLGVMGEWIYGWKADEWSRMLGVDFPVYTISFIHNKWNWNEKPYKPVGAKHRPHM